MSDDLGRKESATRTSQIDFAVLERIQVGRRPRQQFRVQTHRTEPSCVKSPKVATKRTQATEFEKLPLVNNFFLPFGVSRSVGTLSRTYRDDAGNLD